MVKKIKMMAVFAIATMLVIVGCNNITDNASVSGKSVDSRGSIGVFLGSVSRSTLAPATLTVNSAEIDHYSITGESITGYKIDPAVTLTKDAIVAGEAKLTNVQLDDWNFTLYAHDASGKVLLSGTSVCNMKSAGATTVTFNLSSYGLTSVGSYDITIKYTGTAWKDSVYSFTWGLYDEYTGKLLDSDGVDGGSNAVVTVGAAEAVAIHTAEDYYVASKTNVLPGSYTFGVYIMNGSNVLGYASEKIIIEPGRKTTGVLTLNDNIIKTAPAAPTGLLAQRIVGSETKDDENFYNVRLAWVDNSNNEESFELILKEFTTTAEDWTAYAADEVIANAAPTYVYSYSSILTLTNTTDRVRYIDGSLYAGSQELILNFPTGTMWDVQIRAVNSVGKSAACLRVADSTVNQTLTYDGAPAPTTIKTTHNDWTTYNVTGFDVGATGANKHINLTKISYFLDGGTLTLAGEVSPTKTYVEYVPYTLKTDGATPADKFIPLMVITPQADATASDNTLVRTGIDCSKWILSSTATTTQAAVTYNTDAYKNFSVIAVYGQTTGEITISSVTIQALAHESFSDAKLTAYYGTDPSAPMSTNDCKNRSIKLARGADAQYITVTVATDPLFSYYRLYVGDSPIEEKAYATSSISFANFSTDRLETGCATCIRVDAYTEGGEAASASFYITKTN